MYTFKIIVTFQNGVKSKSVEVTSKDSVYYTPVIIDDEGREYFVIKIADPEKLLRCYHLYMWDAVHAVRSGYADLIITDQRKHDSLTVIKYIDDQYGKTVRDETIEKFKSVNNSRSLYNNMMNHFDWWDCPFVHGEM